MTNKFTRTVLAASLLAAFGVAQVRAETPTGDTTPSANGKILEQTSGAWRANCFTDNSSPEPYCRIMVIHFFNKSGKGLDFAQFGPAFDRDMVGFVVATYYGFASESHITVGIDDNPPINMPAPRESNQIAAPVNISQELLEQMQTGKAINIEFKMKMRGKKTLSYPLDGFRELKASVDKVLAGN